jgi:hypothetical protein
VTVKRRYQYTWYRIYALCRDPAVYGAYISRKKEAVGTLTACCYRAFNRISVSCSRVNVTGLPLVLEAFIAPLMMPCRSVLSLAPIATT